MGYLSLRLASLPAFVCVAVAPSAIAQSETLTTRDTVEVWAQYGSFPFARQSVPPNTLIPAPSWSLLASQGGGASARCGVQRSPGALTIQESGSYFGSGYAGTTNVPSSYQIGPHRFLHHISGTGSGNMVIEVTGTRGTIGNLAVDVGDDNSIELSEWFSIFSSHLPNRVTVPVRFATGLSIAIDTACRCGQQSGTPYDYRIDVRFERGTPATITPYGSPCNATLTGSDTFAGGQHQLSFLVRGQPSSLIAVLFGLNPVQIPIFGTNCDQLTDLVNYALLPANALGEATFGFTLPAPLQADVRMQALSWTPVPILTATAGLRVVLSD